MDSHDELPNGSDFGGCRIEGVLGRGGMGVVYRATQVQLDRPVALKVLSPALAQDAEFRARFTSESRLAAAIDHPNVVPIYEAGEDNGRLFITMRFVDGVDLGRLVDDRGPLEPERTAAIVSQVADALDAAHMRGLVHRDVKPANILLASEGSREHAYLADFGLTKASSAQSGLTQTGMWVGTANFVSPEQLRGEEVDGRTDFYALGCVLYQCLTARAPYERDSDLAVMWAHVNDQPPRPTEVVTGLPEAFDSVIARALAKDPNARFQTGAELSHAITLALRGGSLPTPQAPEAPPQTAGAVTLPPPNVPASAVDAPTASAAPPVRARDRSGVLRPPRRRHRSKSPPNRAAAAEASVRIPLTPAFRFTHEPLGEDNAIPLLGNAELVNALASRVEHSTEGSVLITGFRGVGKTTVVLRTLRRIGSRKEGAQLIPVVINVSRPRPLPELLFEIIRKLYEHLEDSNVLETLDPAFAAKLKTAYDRTSRTIREITTRAHERSGGVNLGISVPGLSTGPSMSASQRLSVSDGIEAEFLAYTESDIEQDFARFVGLLRRGVPSKRTNGLTTRVFRRGRSRGEWRAQVVVVIDELDKLSETPGGTEWMRGLLMSLKNLLTVEGVHFIFVAGPDVYEAAIEDAQRGNSVYDSVFSWQDYIPCVWGAEDSLLDAVVTDPVSRSAPELERVRDHLAFRGRGVPRLLLRELNRLVDWEGNQPCLRLDSRKVAEVELYAGLQRLIRKFIEVHADRELDPVHLDQWRLGVYYAVDWILRCGLTFTADDIVALGAGDGLDSLLALSDDEVEDLLEHLESCGVLVRNSADPADDTFYGDVPEAQAPVYAVSDQLESVVRPQEAAEGLPDLAHAPVGAGRSLRGGRYELIAELDRGGSGRVYRARDSESGVEVAVKVFDLPGLRGNEFMRSRFKREARIALELDHPNIVKGRDAFTEPDGTLAFVTDLVGGASLAQRLVQEGPLSPAKSVAVAARILDALDYLNAKGIARLDLRPSSIMVDEQLAPTLTKFGLAKHVVDEKDDGVTRTGAILGTPAYAAPEQLRGESVDIRADLYSLGLILYEMVTGRRARDAASMGAAIDAALGQQIDLDSLPISIELRRVLAKALDSDPGGRFADPADMHASLDSAPEAQTD